MVVLPDGSRYVLRAQILQTSTKTRVDDEGTLKPASRMKTNVIKETAGIGTGAVTGAILGGGPGALVGSLIGAGVMTTNILVQHPADVKVPKDSVLTMSLTQPMVISPGDSEQRSDRQQLGLFATLVVALPDEGPGLRQPDVRQHTVGKLPRHLG